MSCVLRIEYDSAAISRVIGALSVLGLEAFRTEIDPLSIRHRAGYIDAEACFVGSVNDNANLCLQLKEHGFQNQCYDPPDARQTI